MLPAERFPESAALCLFCVGAKEEGEALASAAEEAGEGLTDSSDDDIEVARVARQPDVELAAKLAGWRFGWPTAQRPGHGPGRRQPAASSRRGSRGQEATGLNWPRAQAMPKVAMCQGRHPRALARAPASAGLARAPAPTSVVLALVAAAPTSHKFAFYIQRCSHMSRA